MPKVSIESVADLTKNVLMKCGVCEQSTDIISDTILYANRRGVATHGIGRLPLYVKKIKSGHFNPKDEVEVVVDSDATAILDAHGGFGQVAAKHAVDIGLEKAKKYGVAVVGVKNSNNFGTAGYFGEYAARRGMAALVFANAAPAIAPTGGNKTIFGTNPMCYAFPGSEKNEPVILDMATTVAARGKIRLAAKNDEKIPLDWAVDENGNPTDDPNEALKGSLLPIAGYKGYGLSLFVDVFAGLLTGSACCGKVKQLSNMREDSNNGNLFIIIDTKRFMSPEELNQRVDCLFDSVKQCGKEGTVLLPGEREHKNLARQTKNVVISQKQFDEVNSLAESLEIDSRLAEV